MIKVRKYIIISVILMILTIPMFFGFFIAYFTIRELNWVVIINTIFGLFMLLFMGKIVENFGYNQKNVKVIGKHDVINALINGDCKIIIWFFFSIIIIIEELIFRYYTIGFLDSALKLKSVMVIIISSLIFSIYHIHTWFRYKNLLILIINLAYSFILGLYTGYLFLNLGIIPCIVIHYALVLYLYYHIFRKYFKIND